MAWQYNIGATRKILAVHPKTVAHCMEKTADTKLGSGILLPYATHDARSRFSPCLFLFINHNNSCFRLPGR